MTRVSRAETPSTGHLGRGFSTTPPSDRPARVRRSRCSCPCFRLTCPLDRCDGGRDVLHRIPCTVAGITLGEDGHALTGAVDRHVGRGQQMLPGSVGRAIRPCPSPSAVDVAAGDAREDRGVDHAQALDAVHLQAVRIGDGPFLMPMACVQDGCSAIIRVPNPPVDDLSWSVCTSAPGESSPPSKGAKAGCARMWRAARVTVAFPGGHARWTGS